MRQHSARHTFDRRMFLQDTFDSHCVYATRRDATDSFRVIVPREAVGERCELMHEVFLLDIDLDLGDVVEVNQVVRYLEERGRGAPPLSV